MNEWIEFLVYAALVTTIWFGFPASSLRFALAYVADRNPAWLAARAGFAEKLAGARWSLWACYGLGTLSLAVLLAFQLGLWLQTDTATEPSESWVVLQSIAATSAFVAIAYFAVAGALFNRWLRREVPLAERRRASLERRSIDDFVPRWLRIATYFSIGVHWTAWATVGVLGLYLKVDFWPRLVGQFVFPLVFVAFMHAAVARRPNVMDRIFGYGNRRSEVQFAFAMQFYLLAWGALNLYAAVTETTAFDVQRATHLAPALIVITAFCAFVLNTQRQTGGTDPPLGYSSNAKEKRRLS